MAGALGPCVACGSVSKYKCPTCYDPTCSLACSKQHRQTHLMPGGPAAASSSSSLPSPAPVARPKQTVSTAATSGAVDRLKTNTYVPLNSYDENQFLHDYHFLSSIGRKVSSVGSSLLSQGLLPQQVEANLSAVHSGSSSQARQNGEKPIGPVFRSDFETVKRLRHREALKEEMKRRRCKVMWLPEGMGREKENRTKWDERGKKVKFSLEVAYFTAPSSSSSPSAPAVEAEAAEGQKKRKLYHDLPGMLPLQVKLMSEWERESWKWASKEWKEEYEAKQAALPDSAEGSRPNHNGHSAGGPSSKRGRKRKRGRGGAQSEAFPHNVAGNAEPQLTDKTEVAPVEEVADPEDATPRQHQPKTFYISDYVLSLYGLLHAIQPAEEASDERDEALKESQIPKPYTALPPSVLLAVQVHEVRLRNESSTKYLEWWARKGKDMQEGEGDEEDPAAEWEEAPQGPPVGPRALLPSVRGQTQDGGWPKRERPAQPVQTGQTVPPAPPSGPRSQQMPPTGPRSQRIAQHHMEAAQDAAQESPVAPPAIVESTSAAPASMPLLSHSLLSSLSARLGATRPHHPPKAETVAPEPVAESVPTLAPTSAAALAVSPPSAQMTRPKTLLYPLPKRFLGLEALLRSIPREHAVVEYARVEVWNKAEFKAVERSGAVGVVRHEGQEEDEEQEEAEGVKKSQEGETKAQEEVKKEEASPVAADEMIEPKAKSSSSAPAPTSTPASKPMLSLVGYDSDSDSEEEQEEVAVASKPARLSAVAPPLTTQSDPVKTLAQAELLLNTSSGSSTPFDQGAQEDGNEGKGEGEEEAAAGGLAGIARMLGMVPPAPAAGTASVAAADEDALPPKRSEERTKVDKMQPMSEVDEEEVDWEME